LIKKGQVLGDTGDTGMAGGEYLHLGVLVGGEQVNPIDWWDATWVKNNITGKSKLPDE
jgi:murein DD-endopeptidase MepM/ murein hydrolase activator NlpD